MWSQPEYSVFIAGRVCPDNARGSCLSDSQRVLAWMTTLPYHYSSSASTLTYVMMCRGGLLDAYSWPAASTVKQAQHNPLLAQRCTRSAHAFDL